MSIRKKRLPTEGLLISFLDPVEANSTVIVIGGLERCVPHQDLNGFKVADRVLGDAGKGVPQQMGIDVAGLAFGIRVPDAGALADGRHDPVDLAVRQGAAFPFPRFEKVPTGPARDEKLHVLDQARWRRDLPGDLKLADEVDPVVRQIEILDLQLGDFLTPQAAVDHQPDDDSFTEGLTIQQQLADFGRAQSVKRVIGHKWRYNAGETSPSSV